MKSTRGFALKSTHGIAIKSTNLASGEMALVRRNTRQFYDGEESCYIIDAKLEGNLGRYLNVSLPVPLLWPLSLICLPDIRVPHPSSAVNWPSFPHLNSGLLSNALPDIFPHPR